MDNDVEFTENFADVTADKYYYREIGIAKKLGYTEGRGDNIFDPAGNISRQDMAVMAFRILRTEGIIDGGDVSKTEKRVADFEQNSGYAREAVAAMGEGGLLNGYETGDFKPHGNATRAETAVFLNKVLNVIEKR